MQLELWGKYIQEKCKESKQYDLTLSQIQQICSNPSIQRSFSQEDIQQLCDHLVKNKLAFKNEQNYIIPPGSVPDMASKLYAWVKQTGRENQIETLFNLKNEENTFESCEAIRGLPDSVAVLVLKELESQGKCTIMEFGGEVGCKFHTA